MSAVPANPLSTAPALAAEQRPLHVTHVMLSLDVGGLERNVLNQVLTAPRLPQRVSIICLERPGTLADAVRHAGAEVFCLHKPPGLRPALIPRLRSLFRTLGTDVVHTHQIASLLYAGPAAKLARVALVVHTEHGKERYAARRRTRLLGRTAGLFAQSFYCLSNDMAAAVRRSRIVPGHKLRVIHNGIDTQQFLRPADTTSVRAAYEIPFDAPLIGTVGRLTPVKRQDVLIDAFATVLKRVPAAHLLLVGEGPLRGELERRAAALNIAARVHFAGYQSPTTPFIGAMDLFALTSDSEGMPQAAIEAAVCRVPVVATRVGGVPELIEDGVTGLLAPAGEAGAVAIALDAMLRDPVRAARLAAAGHERAIARFDIARMAGDYHRHFLQALAGR